MELCQQESDCFAGVGVMLESPGLTVRLHGPMLVGSESIPRIQTSSDDRLVGRICEVMDLRSFLVSDRRLPSFIEVTQTLPLHNGLGAGTQTACAVATALELWDRRSAPASQDWGLCTHEMRDLDAAWLAKYSGRGLRSAIGLSGFLTGGIVLDRGYSPARSADAAGGGSRLVNTQSAVVPSNWQVVLIVNHSGKAVSGKAEASMLGTVGQIANPTKRQMIELAEEIMRCVRAADGFQHFVHCLDRYMQLAGQVFAKVQGGYYTDSQIEETVRKARQAGLRGVGQSSWGPTVFGFCEHPGQASEAASQLRRLFREPDSSVYVAGIAKTGAEFRFLQMDAQLQS